jgi:hypothetical protein
MKMKTVDKNELLIRCWTTPGGTWLYYCHLVGTGKKGKPGATSAGPMGMRHIDRIDDLEDVLGEILNSIKKALPGFPRSPGIGDHTGEGGPGRPVHFGTGHPVAPSQNDAVTASRLDRPFCTHISVLERFFETLPLGYSTNRSCADCATKKNGGCLKEYRFGPADVSRVNCPLSGLHGIDLKGICLGT